MDETDRKRENADAFGAVADAYRESAVHRAGADLDMLAAWCSDAECALDVACGAGHTAGALASAESRDASTDADPPRVIAVDVTREMVATATETFSIEGAVGDAERLPFADGSFDAVTCRIAAHHFPDPEAFVREVARVLEPGGTFAFEDCVVPEDDDLAAFVNRFERLRDPSHVEMYPASDWESRLRAAGFEIEATRTMAREMDYSAWVDRTDPDEAARATLAELVRTPEAERAYGIEIEDGTVRRFHNRKALIRAVLPA